MLSAYGLFVLFSPSNLFNSSSMASTCRCRRSMAFNSPFRFTLNSSACDRYQRFPAVSHSQQSSSWQFTHSAGNGSASIQCIGLSIVLPLSKSYLKIHFQIYLLIVSPVPGLRCPGGLVGCCLRPSSYLGAGGGGLLAPVLAIFFRGCETLLAVAGLLALCIVLFFFLGAEILGILVKGVFQLLTCQYQCVCVSIAVCVKGHCSASVSHHKC